MEAAGLAIGAVALAGLFSNCLECYKLATRASKLNKEHAILAAKLDNQELRFLSWGRACGLLGGVDYDERLNEPELRARIMATLRCIRDIFNEGERLNQRYSTRPKHTLSSALPATEDIPGSYHHALTIRDSWPLGSFFRRKKEENRKQRKSVFRKAQWALLDREKLIELIQHLKDFNDDLEALTSVTDVPRRQRRIVEYEIEEIDDVRALEDIASASGKDSDVVSDVASLRLKRMKYASSSASSRRTASSSGSRSSRHTARAD